MEDFIIKALLCRTLKLLFKSTARSYSSPCSQSLMWITKTGMSCFLLNCWQGRLKCLQKVLVDSWSWENHIIQTTADIPSNTPFLPSCPGKGEVVFSRISPWLQPFASTTVDKEGSPSSDQPIAAALREKESSSSTLEVSLVKFMYL